MAEASPGGARPFGAAQTLATGDNRRGMQDLLGLLGGDPARSAALAAVEASEPILVCAGFPVGGRPETDGPPGAIALADALIALGKAVRFASYPAVLDAIKAVRPHYEALPVPIGGRSNCEPAENVSVITIEVCGECADGVYRNMHRQDISEQAPHFEAVIGYRALISVGDGGNEFGMGAAPDKFFVQRNVIRPKAVADILVPASVSNYGAYAIVREMEKITDRKLLPGAGAHARLIQDLVTLGFVDGFSGKPGDLAVDGRDLGQTRRLLDALSVA